MAEDARPDPSEQELGAALQRLAATGGAAARPQPPASVRGLGQRRHRRRAAGLAAGTALGVAAAGGIAYGTGVLGTDPGPTTVAAAPSASPEPTSTSTPTPTPAPHAPTSRPRGTALSPTPSLAPTASPQATRVPPPETPPPTPDPSPTSTPPPPPDPMPPPLSAFLRPKGMTATLAPWQVTGTADNAGADAPASRCLQQPSPDFATHAYERDFATNRPAKDDGAEIIVPSADSAAAADATARLTQWFSRCLVAGQETGQKGDTIIDQPLAASFGRGARVIALTFPSASVRDAVPAEYAAYGRGGPDGNTVVIVVVRYTGQDVIDPASTVVDPLRRALARLT